MVIVMKKIAFLLGLVSLAGCDNKLQQQDDADVMVVDQCNRQTLFLQCLSTVPSGPQATEKSDWADVVDNCETSAYYESIRPKKYTKPECAVSR